MSRKRLLTGAKIFVWKTTWKEGILTNNISAMWIRIQGLFLCEELDFGKKMGNCVLTIDMNGKEESDYRVAKLYVPVCIDIWKNRDGTKHFYLRYTEYSS